MSDFLAGAGVLVAAAGAIAAILLPAGRARAAAMLTALALFPVLILGDQWHTRRIEDLREGPAKIALLLVAGALLVAALAWIFRTRPKLLLLTTVAVLPFRVPLHSGGDTANLLIPLYLVIAGGVLASCSRVLFGGVSREPFSRFLGGGAPVGAPRGAERRLAASTVGETGVTGPARNRAATLLPFALATFVALYALQSLYSEDFSKALQEVCFFLVPFSLAYALLREAAIDRRTALTLLAIVAAEAVAFTLIGSIEYASRSLFWNDAVITSNEFHTYFRVNSVFWDPNVYGRYLALALVLVTTALLYARERRAVWLCAGTILVLWIGLAQTFSQSSFIALLAGLAILAALRWSWRWTLAAVLVAALAGAAVIVLVGGSGKLTSDRLNVDLSGRGNLVSGGLGLFVNRPLWGYGSGSFQEAYRNHRPREDAPVTISHTEPVTVLAEGGLIGFAAYVGLVVIALWAMGAGLWKRPPPAAPVWAIATRAAILAAFVALLAHTMAYAGFFQDPITWVLLALGGSAALAAGRTAVDRDDGMAAA